MFRTRGLGESAWGKFIALLVISLMLMFIDHHFVYIKPVRSWLSTVTTPVQWLADVPANSFYFIEKKLISHNRLLEENEKVKAHNLFLQQQLQKFSELSSENKQLRMLLNSSQRMEEQVQAAEVIGIDPDPQIQQIIVNKGLHDGAYVGQPVLDASGIMGQIISSNYLASRILLITDSSSRIPVKIDRNGYRAIAAGNYAHNTLSLLNMPLSVDIKEGDLLISSGLGNRFPSGYPVAKITSVKRLSGESFLQAYAAPLAKINQTRLVLLLFSRKGAPGSSGNSGVPPIQPGQNVGLK